MAKIITISEKQSKAVIKSKYSRASYQELLDLIHEKTEKMNEASRLYLEKVAEYNEVMNEYISRLK
jgi:flagellar motor component MotA